MNHSLAKTLGLGAALALTGAATEASAALPDRVWGTYVGGDNWDEAKSVAVDEEGNVYVCGRTGSPSGIATAGTHQTAFAGFADAYLLKFSPAGERLWGTYFGGAGDEYCHGVSVREGQVALIGITLSTAGIATPGAFQTSSDGNQACGFAAVFTPAGAQTWGSYLCGPDDGVSPIALTIDSQGAVYVGGATNTSITGLTTPASHQPEYADLGIEPDGFLARFDAQGKLAWGTYYGGCCWDVVRGVSVNDLGELYIAGDSESPEGIASPGAHKTLVQIGETFLARFTADGERLWGTYFGGAEGDEFGDVVALPQGGAALIGQTLSSDQIATAGTHQTSPDGGEDDMFVARFDADGEQLWGTYFGGPGHDPVTGVATDAAGDIYVAGTTNSFTSVATPGAFQPMLVGSDDALVAKFDGAGALRWSTYYGGAGQFDWSDAVAVTPGGDVYLVGVTYSAGGIASPGAHDDELGGDNDGFLVRLSQDVGATCRGPADCRGGSCVDGVCCDAPCGGGADDCQACAASLGAVADGVCTLLGPTATCRPAASECDAAEMCNGDSVDCPADLPATDGELCEVGSCEAGACIPGAATTTDPTDGESSTTTGPGEPAPTTGEPDPTEHVPEDSTGPTTGHVPGDSSGPTTDASSDSESATGGQTGESGCGCHHDAGPLGALAPALLLLLRRRRTA
ncbi:SBBP repeat-containing protein [Nannocystis radixulma]|uniref:SBBP repeat-containing protein n=1 Tax=Nannocystis radixulma TaxID=2995305 RepID=A0ABT5BH80_9BACT|nr:SBBP repeat-containing protein [Nannocystis radixulma]MDC0672773.1 SBBP repeat-containing protein [Nannocystis radixulma]